MAVRIDLENPPEFYTNMDTIQGRVFLGFGRNEQVSAIIVKLEGECKTSLTIPDNHDEATLATHGTPGDVVQENHKILYKVAKVFPDENNPPPGRPPYFLAPGQHHYPFRFKLPFNNACGNQEAMARLGNLATQNFLSIGGVRVMDGTKQLLYRHVTQTLPPSFTGFPRQAEVRYYIKVTVQRPGLFKENWRTDLGFKFLPIEPPRPPPANREAYARRPFRFRLRAPPSPGPEKRLSFLTGRRSSSALKQQVPQVPQVQGDGAADHISTPVATPPYSVTPPSSPESPEAPSVEMSARLPHPSILTCNKPIPLRLVSRKLSPAPGEISLVSLQIDLIGSTRVRALDLINTETTRWVVVSLHGLSVPVSRATDPAGTETVVPDSLWRDIPLPNTIMPSFGTCNLTRTYYLELKIGLNCGGVGSSRALSSQAQQPQQHQQSASVSSFFRPKARSNSSLSSGVNQTVYLPLHFNSVEVYSGLTPPPSLVEALKRQRSTAQPGRAPPQRPPQQPQRPQQQQQASSSNNTRPALPPRPTAQQAAAAGVQPPDYDPLYPPQLAPGQSRPYADDAPPPSYDEAMAESVPGPAVPSGSARPAYSGMTNENSPSTIPEKE